MLGDFNTPNYTVYPNNGNYDIEAALFDECLATFDLKQYNPNAHCTVDSARIAIVPEDRYHTSLFAKLQLKNNLQANLPFCPNQDEFEGVSYNYIKL